MPSNKDLVTSINAEAEAKGVDVPDIKGKNNAQLSAILKELKKPVAPKAPAAPGASDEATGDADETNTADDATGDDTEAVKETKAPAAPKAEAKKPKKRPPFYVKDGKAITTKKGTLSDGDEIKAEYLGGGKVSLDAHVKAGNVGKG